MTDDARPLLVFFSVERSGPARRMESLLAHLARKERRPAARRAASTSTQQPELAERFEVEMRPDARARQGQARRRAARRARERAADRGDARAASRAAAPPLATPVPPPPEIRSLRPPGTDLLAVGSHRGKEGSGMRKLVLRLAASWSLLRRRCVVAAIAAAGRRLAQHQRTRRSERVPGGPATISTTGGGTFRRRSRTTARVVPLHAHATRGSRAAVTQAHIHFGPAVA